MTVRSCCMSRSILSLALCIYYFIVVIVQILVTTLYSIDIIKCTPIYVRSCTYIPAIKLDIETLIENITLIHRAITYRM